MVATPVVLVAVFVPIAFLEGNTGRLFTEFALALAAAAMMLAWFVATKKVKLWDDDDDY